MTRQRGSLAPSLQVEPEDLEGVPSAYIRKDSLALDDSLETSATDSPDDEE